MRQDDRGLALQVQAWLRIAGLRSTFLDVDPDSGIGAGRRWEDELYAALRLCDAVVFISSAEPVEVQA